MIKDISRQHPFGLRIPEELKARLELASEQNARSLNSEMVVRLADSFKRPLSDFPDGELIAELLSRYERGTISIRIDAKGGDDSET
ncbi:MAG: Arc family DNA-binding protein [Formivibrio sp.]|nr:Arc family DNA-binding protein [Formivibrio sp.]